ncbi:MAG TPA: hypothetical protein VFM35_01225, partial [Candidatus Binatia bacterium]|nr:hypothetical protein [Candidatus Binatia bacterium]
LNGDTFSYIFFTLADGTTPFPLQAPHTTDRSEDIGRPFSHFNRLCDFVSLLSSAWCLIFLFTLRFRRQFAYNPRPLCRPKTDPFLLNVLKN